ncbi:MAG TPA: molecular chaperone DnaJ [Actinomycetota bacterium]
MPDYYQVLGVSREASVEDIKRAYRKLARESHPDANHNDPHAEERFKSISEAYAVLSDPQKRQQFDTFGTADPRAGFGGAGFGGFGDLGDIVDAFFGGGGFGRTRARPRTSAVAGADLVVDEVLTLEEAVFGATRSIEVTSLSACEQCAGDGCAPGTFRGRCSRCGGTGELRATRQTILGTVMTSRACGTCGGVGEAPTVPCEACGGAGRVNASRKVDVEIPGGVGDGTSVRLRGRGEAGVRGGPDGDLFVRIHVRQHEIFERDGDHLVCDLEIPLVQAVLGAEIPLQTLDGEQTVTIPPGTHHGTVVKMRGLGATRLDGRGRGDLLVHVSVQVPQKLTAEERSLFEQLASLRGEATGGGRPVGMFRRLRDTLRG